MAQSTPGSSAQYRRNMRLCHNGKPLETVDVRVMDQYRQKILETVIDKKGYQYTFMDKQAEYTWMSHRTIDTVGDRRVITADVDRAVKSPTKLPGSSALCYQEQFFFLECTEDQVKECIGYLKSEEVKKMLSSCAGATLVEFEECENWEGKPYYWKA